MIELLIITTELLESSDALGFLSEKAEIGVKEGARSWVRHRRIERPACQKFREKMISDSKELNKGKVPCEVCEIDMLGRYSVGVPIIDCHHLYPLSELDGEQVVTTEDDLALLCPSCHRAIHKLDDCSNLDELRERLRE